MATPAHRYTDDELHVDRHGVPAGETLFVDKMPPTYTEAELRELIVSDAGSAAALVNIWCAALRSAPLPLPPQRHRLARTSAPAPPAPPDTAAGLGAPRRRD